MQSDGMFCTLMLMGGYFLPSLIAFSRGARRMAVVFMLNIVLGWTFVAWAALLVLALCDRTDHADAPVEHVVVVEHRFEPRLFAAREDHRD